MRVTRTATVTATSGVPEILQYWWLIAGAGGILAVIIVSGTVAYQESERQKLLALAR